MRLLAVIALNFTGLSAFADDAPQRLSDVRKIFVASFGSAEGADLIREKVIVRLVKYGKITVVESPEDADASLAGVAERSTGVRYNANSGLNGSNATGGTTYNASLVVRLVGKSKQILWADEATPRLWGSSSVSSNVADKIVKDLIKAIEKGTVK